MNKRETFKEQDFFDKEVIRNEQSIADFSRIASDPATTPDHRRQLLCSLFLRQVEQLILRYSRGESVSSLAVWFPQIVGALAAYHKEAGHSPYGFEELDSYVFALWLVSLAILLDVEESCLRDLLREINNEGRDALYERLVSLRVPGRPQPKTLLYPKPYQPLLEAHDATGEQRDQLIGTFLKNYYKGMKNAYWHDSHLGEDAGFFGYWCFELAAFVKVLDIDDHTFADNIFYPIDLVRDGSQR